MLLVSPCGGGGLQSIDPRPLRQGEGWALERCDGMDRVIEAAPQFEKCQCARSVRWFTSCGTHTHTHPQDFFVRRNVKPLLTLSWLALLS